MILIRYKDTGEYVGSLVATGWHTVPWDVVFVRERSQARLFALESQDAGMLLYLTGCFGNAIEYVPVE